MLHESLSKVSRLIGLPKAEAALLPIMPGRLGRFLRSHQYRRIVTRCANQPMPPVLIYTMMKVASTSVTEALLAIGGLTVFQIHAISEARLRRVRQEIERRGLTSVRQGLNVLEDFAHALAKELIKPGHPLKVIALVREPIARNASFYFQSLDNLWQKKNAHENIALDRLLAEYEDRFRHESVLDWFDEEFRPVLGIDVYAHPFPRDRGFCRINAGPYEVLIMRHDLDDRVKETLLAELLGVEGVTIVPKNLGSQKSYAKSYREFLFRIELTNEYVDRMLDSKYARHFFPAEELRSVRAKWLDAPARTIH